MKKLPIQIRILIIIAIVVLIIGGLKAIVGPGVNLYNSSTELKLAYNQKCQEQVTNYDGYYQTFIDKQTNANINKDVFIEVTDIIMSNRHDGEAVAWKWVTENQQIPYGEFTEFYKELSAFISERYADNMAIEREKQEIVRRYNTALLLFPANTYNSFLHLQPLVYKAGYVSPETQQRFK